MNFPRTRTFSRKKVRAPDRRSVGRRMGQEMLQGAQSVDNGLSELSEALRAIALKPDDPPVAPRALIRLLMVLRTLDEPDEAAGTA